jgi:hypothetical protein
MPKFPVQVSRTITQSNYFFIEAATQEEALERATDLLSDKIAVNDRIHATLDGCEHNYGALDIEEPYFTDQEYCADDDLDLMAL